MTDVHEKDIWLSYEFTDDVQMMLTITGSGSPSSHTSTIYDECPREGLWVQIDDSSRGKQELNSSEII